MEVLATISSTAGTRLAWLSTCLSHVQEVGWFDREENASGALASRLSADTAAIRGALGDQVTFPLPYAPVNVCFWPLASMQPKNSQNFVNKYTCAFIKLRGINEAASWGMP